jgi:hypothetical protein
MVQTAVTGSDTSSDSLFGQLQVTAAHQTGMSEVLLASANASGAGARQDDQSLEPRGGRGSSGFGWPPGRTLPKGVVGHGNPVVPDVPRRLAAVDPGARMDGAMTPAVATRSP